MASNRLFGTGVPIAVSTAAITHEEIRIQPAAAADHADVRRVLDAAYREFAPVLGAGAHDVYLADLLDLDGRGAGQLLVARVGRRVAATVTFYAVAADEGLGLPSGWAGLRALAVDPEFRGLGLARRLMVECLSRAEIAGVDVIALHTASFMTAAVRLYEGLGFERLPQYDFDAAAHLGVDGEPVYARAYARPVAPSAIRRRPVDR
jgi:ribosomal protein S18 acetylase RimI-like enzyme